MNPNHERQQESFEREALPYLDSLYRYGLRLCGDPVQAEDLVQETMVKAFRSWERYAIGTNIRAWLFTIMRNTLISQYRRRRKHAESVDISEVDGFIVFDAIYNPNPSERFFDRLVDEEVVGAIDSLSADYREIVVLADVEDLTYEEIAEVVGIPIGTVKSRLHRARRMLQRKLYDYAVELGFIRPDKIFIGAA